MREKLHERTNQDRAGVRNTNELFGTLDGTSPALIPSTTNLRWRKSMLVQVSTDNHVAGDDELAGKVAADMQQRLKRFSAQITRVEVHIHDDNGDKAGANDKRCVLEARVRGLEPVAVSHNAPSVAEAVKGASDKLVRSLDRTMAKLRHPKGRDPFENEVST